MRCSYWVATCCLAQTNKSTSKFPSFVTKQDGGYEAATRNRPFRRVDDGMELSREDAGNRVVFGEDVCGEGEGFE